MSAIGELYGRVPPLIRALPWLFVLPVAAELAQHWEEIRLGMYAPGGLQGAADAPQRIAFGVVKVLAIVVVLLLSLHWLAFGDMRRAVRPGALFFRGLGLFVLIYLGGELIVLLISRGLAIAAGAALPGELRLALAIAPLIGWLFCITLLLPWFVGMLVEDRAMTARRSIGGIHGRMWAMFGLLLAGILPLMIVHYTLGFAAMGRAPEFVWAIMAADALLIGLLTASIASTYFTIYRRAAERTGS